MAIIFPPLPPPPPQKNIINQKLINLHRLSACILVLNSVFTISVNASENFVVAFTKAVTPGKFCEKKVKECVVRT